VPPGAGAEQRGAIEARMQREWQSLVDYFQQIRGRERASILTGSPLGGSGG
jgi:hypothetical protein